MYYFYKRSKIPVLRKKVSYKFISLLKSVHHFNLIFVLELTKTNLLETLRQNQWNHLVPVMKRGKEQPFHKCFAQYISEK